MSRFNYFCYHIIDVPTTLMHKIHWRLNSEAFRKYHLTKDSTCLGSNWEALTNYASFQYSPAKYKEYSTKKTVGKASEIRGWNIRAARLQKIFKKYFIFIRVQSMSRKSWFFYWVFYCDALIMESVLILPDNTLLYFMSTMLWKPNFILVNIYSTSYYLSNLLMNLLDRFKQTIGEGFLYLRGLVVIFVVDACLTDDEPLWEPVEWSLVQSWIMFIFLFAWIAENLISSRYGSYTGRDKRVWFSWYKTFWLIELWYVLSLGAASLFVIVPFYYEVTYTTSFIVSWWHWYSRVFFFKFVSLYTIILLLSYYLQINIRYFYWTKSFLIILLINIFLSYLLYIHFMMSFFGYFTDRNWYHKARLVDYIQLSHEPNKWSWGSDKRDHFTQHKSTTVFWFKNDGPFASAFLFFHLFFFIALFTLYFYWITLARRVYATQEVTYTFTIYCISALKQFFYFFFLLYILIFLSFLLSYWRMPVEQAWLISSTSWFGNLILIITDYWLLIKQTVSI